MRGVQVTVLLPIGNAKSAYSTHFNPHIGEGMAIPLNTLVTDTLNICKQKQRKEEEEKTALNLDSILMVYFNGRLILFKTLNI